MLISLFSPTSRVSDVLLMYCFGTVILQVYLLLPDFAVILAVPAFFAVTLPLLSTVTIDLLLLDQLGLFLEFF